ncbi:unnamed protein product [Ambrosiozyma monospora]|uniref:Unnamed protein product n=1 Tax=Ambrosiozyma monospora TaxID=43982 RepID=A0ACB5T912_AMBMO|nr:unnamed protein product [Ambrosiozyma monospora]
MMTIQQQLYSLRQQAVPTSTSTSSQRKRKAHEESNGNHRLNSKRSKLVLNQSQEQDHHSPLRRVNKSKQQSIISEKTNKVNESDTEFHSGSDADSGSSDESESESESDTDSNDSDDDYSDADNTAAVVPDNVEDKANESILHLKEHKQVDSKLKSGKTKLKSKIKTATSNDLPNNSLSLFSGKIYQSLTVSALDALDKQDDTQPLDQLTSQILLPESNSESISRSDFNVILNTFRLG